jgi:SpoIIAA-like
MVERIADMQPGTLGFRVAGHMKREDYIEVLVPPLRDAVEAGEPLRVLYAIGPELHLEPGAVWEDLKVEMQFGIKHREAWERIAVVTDLDWLWRAFNLFSWMVPGDMRLFREAELEQAKAWLTTSP